MRTLLRWKLGIGIALLTNWLNLGSIFAQDSTIEDAFRDGLYQEEVEGKLEAALSTYKDVTARVKRLRQLGAKALFREAAVLRKLERNEEAIARYETLLLQYPEDETLAKLSKEHLIALGVQLPNPSNTSNIPKLEQEEIARLKRIVTNSPDLLNAGEGESAPPLHLAAQKGQLHVAKFLLNQGANVNRPWQHGAPLQLAAKSGHKVMCELLLDRGAKNEALLAAIENSRNAVALLLLDRGADPNAEAMVWSRNNKTFAKAKPIHLATFGKSSTAVLEALLNAGADPNDVMSAPTDAYSETRTPLSQAIYGGFAEWVQILLKAGADPRQRIRHDRYEDHERTMLQMALACQIREARPAIIDAVLEAGAKWTEGDIQFTLGRAAKSQKRLKAALDSGIDPNTGNGHHRYPAVHVAASQNATGALAMLLAHGASVDIRNNEGETALHYLCKATSHEYLDTVNWLINHGADVDALDNDGNAPLDLALSSWRKSNSTNSHVIGGSSKGLSWKKGALLLLKHGANPRAGKTIPAFSNSDVPDEELFEKFWNAYHLTHNPQRPKAVWLSRRIGAAELNTSSYFAAFLSQELLPEPGNLQRFLHTAQVKLSKIHPKVTVTRLKEDGTDETIQLDLTEKPSFELQWGDVVEVPYQRKGAPEQTKVNDWINESKGMEIRVRIGENHILSNNDRGTYILSDRTMLPYGSALAFLGVSPYFVESHTVAQVGNDGIVAADKHNVIHGNEVQIKVVEAKPKLSEQALRNGVHVCASLDGPFWPVKHIQTCKLDKGIEHGLMAPHGLPLHPIDWEKATIRIKNAEGWDEQRVLEQESFGSWYPGTVFILPMAESKDTWSPHPKLKKQIEEELGLAWQLGMNDEPLTTERYVPPFFTAGKEGNLWIWKDATTPAPRPLVSNPADLGAVHSGDPLNQHVSYSSDTNGNLAVKIKGANRGPTPRPSLLPSSDPGKRRVILPPGLKGSANKP